MSRLGHRMYHSEEALGQLVGLALADLVGLEVVNEQGTPLGVVTRTYSNGAHDVIEVAGDRTRLIPWAHWYSADTTDTNRAAGCVHPR